MCEAGNDGVSAVDWRMLVERSSFPLERLDSARFEHAALEPAHGEDARLRVWDANLSVGGSSGLDKRLSWDGLSRDDAATALSPVRLRVSADLPAWVGALQQIVSAGREAYERGVEVSVRDGEEPFPFEELLRPAVVAARRALDQRLEVIQRGSRWSEVVEHSALADLERALLGRLCNFAAPALYERFDRFRPVGARLLARYAGLAGSDDVTHYRSFVAAELNSGLAGFFTDLPVAARLIANLVEAWIETSAEFLARLSRDAGALTSTFASEIAEPLGRLTAIDPIRADPHEGGRTVLVLRFGSGKRLVYKPRSVAIGAAFTAFVEWCNARGVTLPLPVFRILALDGYGFTEYVEPGDCESEAAAERYFTRAGTLLALLYLLGATDCHHENLIATAAGPVLIDLETLLHPTPKLFVSAAVGDAQSLPVELEDSVLRTGLLPRWAFNRARGVAQDVSGLGADVAQPVLNRRRTLVRVNTDGMCLVELETPIPVEKNVARIRGAALSAAEFHEQVATGFEQMYRLLVREREAIAGPGGPLEPFAACRNRFVFRATDVYARVRSELSQPRYLADGRDFWLGLEQLGKAFVVADEKPGAWPLFHTELTSLSLLDVPLFSANTSSDALVLGPSTSAPGFFVEASHASVQERLRTLDEADCALQLQLVRGSLVAARARPVEAGERRGAPPARAGFSREECLRAAVEIGGELLARAVRRADGAPNWLGLSYEPLANRYQMQLAGEHLYDGRAGIAVFLAALHRASGFARFERLAREALLPVRGQIANLDRLGWQRAFAFGTHGAATGLTSAIYALSKVASLLEDASLLDDALALAANVPEPSQSANWDVVGGAAGALLVLLDLHRATGQEALLAAARRYGEALLAARVSVDGAPRAWSRANLPQLAGLSHGAAGISLALARLYARTGDGRYLDAALEGIAFENTLFSASEKNWVDRRPDLRVGLSPDAPPVYSVQWCNGAPGIALGRLAMSEHVPASEVSADLTAGLEATLAHGLGGPDHLCCGNLGRAEVLLLSGERLARDDCREAALDLTAAVVQRARATGAYRIFSNAPPGVSSAGFFVGSAGIGYQLLRSIEPDLPSILLFE